MTLVIGGARSGKSAYAEGVVEAAAAAGACAGGTYLATAEAGDDEMATRIRAHRERRGHAWTTVEEPLDLVGALAAHATAERPVLVDCLTLWLSNIMAAEREIAGERQALIDCLARLGGPVVFVSNEVGLGLVPTTPLGRAFRDEAGRLNQAVAAAAERVIFVAAGLALTMKDSMAKDKAEP